MYEREVQFITDFNLNKIKNLGTFIPFEKLLASDLHPAIIKYISAEIDFLIYEDRKKLLEKSAFDYSGSKIAEHFNLIGLEIKRTKKISHEDLQKIIVQAVSFNANITVKPRWTLLKLIYNETESKEVHEIKLRLNYVYYYEYLKNILLTYIQKRRLISLSKGEFELILNKIDKELFSTQADKLVYNALSSIADFYNEGGVSKKIIPIPLVEIFLMEKNLSEYISRLKNSTTAAQKNKMEIEELRKVLFLSIPAEKEEEEISKGDIIHQPVEPISEDISIELVKEEGKSETIEDTSEMIEIDEEDISAKTASSNVNEEIIEEDMEIKKKEVDEDTGTLLSSPAEEPELTSDEEEIKFDIAEQDKLETLYDFEEEDREQPVEKIEEIEEDETASFQGGEEKIKDEEILAIEESQSNEIVNRVEETEIEEIKEGDTEPEIVSKSRGKDVFSFLNNKEIEKIISSIFNEDREDFTYTMEKISECKTYNESTEILKAIFSSYRVSPYSKEAVSLTNAVANYFDQG